MDSGFLRTDNSGTQLSSANRANNGSAIVLNNIDFTPSVKANVDDAPEPGTYSEVDVNVASFENIKFVITGLINSRDSSEMGLIYQFIRLCRTKGYKLMYYNGTESQERQAIYELGRDETGTAHTFSSGEQSLFGISSAFRHVHVRFTDFTLKQDPNKLFRFSLTGVFTKVRSSLI